METNFNKSLINYLQKDAQCLPILLVFILILVSPIIYFGIPDGFDLPQHFQFAITYLEAIKTGDFLPSWSANTNYGFGDVGIRFYPPLAHYCLAITQLFTNDWQTSAWLNIFFWMLLGSVGSYFFARQWLSPQNSLLVGILYAIAPYHLSQIYQFFLYSEFVAAAILPFCFLFLTKICRSGKWKYTAKFGLVFALLILSHIPTTIIASICLAIYAIFISDWKKAQTIILKLIFSGLIALSLSSFYWVKLITEINWVSHSTPRFSTGLYGYQDFFFPMFFNTYEIYLVKQMWFKDIVYIITLAFILPLLIFIFVKFNDFRSKKEFRALCLTGIFAFLMSSSLSSFLWANISLLQKIQFPFRWLSVATLMGVLAFIFFQQIPISPSFQIIKNYFLLIFFTTIALFNITQIILPAGLLSNEAFAERLSGLREKESFDCWWTVWSDKKAFEQKEKVIAENRTIKINVWEDKTREFEVGNGNAENARIATFYYPHWQAKVNGKEVEVGKNSDGTISIPLPSDSSNVSLTFIEPFYLRTAIIFSMISWLLLIFIPLFFAIRKKYFGLKLEVVN